MLYGCMQLVVAAIITIIICAVLLPSFIPGIASKWLSLFANGNLVVILNIVLFILARQSVSWDTRATVAAAAANHEKRKADLQVTALVGRNATLECPTQGKDEHRVAWINQESRTILSLHGELVTQSNRYAIIKKELGSFDLVITNIQETDAGTYICQINSNPMRNLVIFLYVVKSPSILPILEDNIEARVGQSVRMECKAEGIPQPKITWKRFHAGSAVVVADNSKVVELRNVTRRDAGQYMCIANNGYPPTVSHTFQLAVLYKPQVNVRFKYIEGDIYQIVCHIRAQPRPAFYGISGANHSQLIREEAVEGFHIYLTANVTAPPNKEYECFAQNEIGHNNKFVYISSDATTETTVLFPTFATTLVRSSPSPLLSSSRTTHNAMRKKLDKDFAASASAAAKHIKIQLLILVIAAATTSSCKY